MRNLKTIGIGVGFASLALGRAKALRAEPSAHAPEDWAWAQASARDVLSILRQEDGSSRWPTEPTKRQMAALAAHVSHACREISASVAEIAVVAAGDMSEGVIVKCGQQEILMARSAEGLSLRSLDARGQLRDDPFQHSFDSLFSISQSDLFDEASLQAVALFGADSGDDLMEAVEGFQEEGREVAVHAHSVLLAVAARLSLWRENFSVQAGLMAAERAATLLYGKPLEGKDASRMLLGAARHRGSDSISTIFNLDANAWEIESAEQAPEAAAFVAAVAPTLFGENGSRELGRDRISMVKKELRKNYGLTDGGWKALLLHCAQSAFFAPALGAELERLSPENAESDAQKDSFIRPGFAQPFSDGETRLEDAAELYGVCLLASLCAARGIRLADGLSFASPCYWTDGVETPVRNICWTGILSMAPISWRTWSEYDQNIESPHNANAKAMVLERRSCWENLLARHEIGNKTLLDPAAFVELYAAGWMPEGDAELTFAALDRDRAARFQKGPALVGAVIQRGIEAGWPRDSLGNEENDVIDFLREVEIGFWDEAPTAMSWPWIHARSQEWHNGVLEKSASAAKWAPLQDGDFYCGPRWIAKELASGGALFREGKEMRHCVSGYAGRCAKGDSRIFSLRSVDGLSKSTIELGCDYGGPAARGADGGLLAPLSVKIVQHRAFANSPPSPMAKIAAERLAKSINDAIAAIDMNARPSLSRPN